jgi:hypothetical protein
MARIMGDSVDVREIPLTVNLVATYINGEEGVVPAALLEALFPSKHYFHVLVDVNGSRPDAHARDWETGDKSGDLRQWVIDHNKHTGKKDAVIYCNKSTIAEVRQLTGDQILGEDYWLWVATLDGTVYRADGVIACQNRGARQNNANYDSSIIFDDVMQGLWTVPHPVGPVTPTTPVKPPIPPARPNCAAIQRALRVQIDNLWGPATDKAGDALSAAWRNEFPYSVAFTQGVVGSRGDGMWGPNSKEALDITTGSVQRALISMGFPPGQVDDIWGPKTQAAYDAARKACHI